MRTLAIVLVLALALPGQAASRPKIAILNVSATSLFTLAGCAIQKRVHSFRDAGRCLAVGGVAGAGFYQAKRVTGRGDITSGWLLSNLATSLVENTTAGEHPLSRIGYTFGPFRLRVVTPFDRRRESLVDVDVSIAESGYLLRAVEDADDIDVRDGMIWYEKHQPEVDNGVVYHGFTWGIFPGTWSGADVTTWRHEAVHAVQSEQLDSIDPPVLTFERKPRIIRLGHVRAGALNVFDNVVWQQRSYDERWAEIEAFMMSEDRKPPDVP